jgi:hypothetical protein
MMGKGERGRPCGQMTRRRAQVLAALESMGQMAPVVVNYAAIGREIGMEDYRNVRRVVGDLRMMGAI